MDKNYEKNFDGWECLLDVNERLWVRVDPFRRDYLSLLLNHLYSSFYPLLSVWPQGPKSQHLCMDFISLHVSSQQIDRTQVSLLHCRLFPLQFYITWENKRDKIQFHQDKTKEWSLTTSLHHSAQVIDCRIYFTLHRIQRVHLLQSGVIYKPYGLTVSFCGQQIQSALMQKHVLSLRERRISTSENDHLTLVYTTTFATYSEICQFLMGLPGFAPCTSSHCAALRPGHIYPQNHDPSYAEWDDPGL